jgi:hypothetical protein
MRTCHYKVKFAYRPSQAKSEKPVRAWIDGYYTAGAAKSEVERVNERTAHHGVSAEYLGDDRRAS